jgi:hypothetical protein
LFHYSEGFSLQLGSVLISDLTELESVSHLILSVCSLFVAAVDSTVYLLSEISELLFHCSMVELISVFSGWSVTPLL